MLLFKWILTHILFKGISAEHLQYYKIIMKIFLLLFWSLKGSKILLILNKCIKKINKQGSLIANASIFIDEIFNSCKKNL